MCHRRRVSRVTHHRIDKGWCAGCQKWHEAPVEVQEEVLGQGRIGVRLASLRAYLRTVLRLPIREIQQMLLTLHGFPVSAAEIVELLHRITEHAQPVLLNLKAQIRASPAVQADETGWREEGTNGYVWSAATPTIRSYESHHSRAGKGVKERIGENFQGVLGSDFYAGYNIHQGLHQRCWVHFLRDVHDLKEDFPHDEELLTWAKAVKAIYEQAVAWTEHDPDPALSPRKPQQARVAQQHVARAAPVEGLPAVCTHHRPATPVRRAGGTVFTRTVCLCGRASCSGAQQPGRAQCSPAGCRWQDPWGLAQSQRQ